ncbi:hypothetical protein [Dactylosporangium cerinum]
MLTSSQPRVSRNSTAVSTSSNIVFSPAARLNAALTAVDTDMAGPTTM